MTCRGTTAAARPEASVTEILAARHGGARGSHGTPRQNTRPYRRQAPLQAPRPCPRHYVRQVPRQVPRKSPRRVPPQGPTARIAVRSHSNTRGRARDKSRGNNRVEDRGNTRDKSRRKSRDKSRGRCGGKYRNNTRGNSEKNARQGLMGTECQVGLRRLLRRADIYFCTLWMETGCRVLLKMAPLRGQSTKWGQGAGCVDMAVGFCSTRRGFSRGTSRALPRVLS